MMNCKNVSLNRIFRLMSSACAEKTPVEGLSKGRSIDIKTLMPLSRVVSVGDCSMFYVGSSTPYTSIHSTTLLHVASYKKKKHFKLVHTQLPPLFHLPVQR